MSEEAGPGLPAPAAAFASVGVAQPALRAAAEYQQLQLRIGPENAARLLHLVQTTGWEWSTLTGMWDSAYGVAVYARGGGEAEARAVFETAVRYRMWPEDLAQIVEGFEMPAEAAEWWQQHADAVRVRAAGQDEAHGGGEP